MSKTINVGMTRPDYSIPDGRYPARVLQLIQIGSQRFEKNGKEWFSPQILVGFEFPTLTYENREEEEVSNIKSATYFLSLNPAKNGVVGLREIIDGLRGSSEYTEEELENFEIAKFLGKECMVTLAGVESRGAVYQNVVKVEPFTSDGNEILPKFRTPILVTIDDFKDLDSLDLPEWIKDKIRASEEYKQVAGMPAPVNEPYKTPEEEGKELKIEDVPF